MFILLTTSLLAVFGPPIQAISNTSAVLTTTLEVDDSLLAVNATILEVISAHAWTNHGTEVNAAIRCLNNNGSTMSFRTFGFTDKKGNPIKTNLWLCREENDWFAIVTTSLEKVGGNRIGKLITAYLVDKKTFFIIDDFIAVIKDKWLAKEINFVIEAGSVFLQPK
jgi:hypothetical protein